MPYRMMLTVTLSAILAAGFGCDQDVAQAQRDRQNYHEAIALVEEATQGYATGEASQGEGQVLPKHEADKLQEALDKLEPMAQAGNDDAQSLVGRIKLRQARAVASDARTEYATVQGRSTALLNYVAAVEEVHGVIAVRTRDGKPTLEDIRRAESMVGESKSRLTASIAELSLKREEAAGKARKLDSDADRLSERADDTQEKAQLVEDSVQQQQAFTRAYQTRREAESVRYNARIASINEGLYASKLKPLENELELWDRMADQLDELTKRVESGDSLAAEDVDLANESKSQAVQSVREQFDALAGQFEDDVAQPLEQAAALTGEAVQAFESAGGSGSDFDLLSAHVERSRVLTMRANYHAAFVEILDAVLKSPAMDRETAGSLVQAREQHADRADALATEARDALDAADALASNESLGAEGQSMAETLKRYRDQLSS